MDEVIYLLVGIQEVYKDLNLRTCILELIRRDVEFSKCKRRGPKGLSIWEIFVLATLRRTGNIDYQKLSNLAANHLGVREILGFGPEEVLSYPVSTLHDNIVKVKPSTFDKINELIVTKGHDKYKGALDKVRADTFVLESNIHYHADYKSLVDGARCMMREGNRLSILVNYSGFRKWKQITKKSKKLGYQITQAKRSKRKTKYEELESLYKEILRHTDFVINKILCLLDHAIMVKFEGSEKEIERQERARDKLYNKIIKYASGTNIEHELTYRRNFLKEKIGSTEKIFSLFEPHTELIMKGKEKKPIEYGHLVYVAQDNRGFMLRGTRVESGHRDKDICITELEKLQEIYEDKIKKITYDKGFYTPENLLKIKEMNPDHYLPPKGRIPEKIKTKDFYKNKNWHSGIESAINAIEQGNNLHVCKDKGLEGFDRCIAASILARNLQTLGCLKITTESKKKRKRQAA